MLYYGINSLGSDSPSHWKRMSICTQLLAWRMECWQDWCNWHDLHVRSCCNGRDCGRLIVGIFLKILTNP